LTVKLNLIPICEARSHLKDKSKGILTTEEKEETEDKKVNISFLCVALALPFL